MAPNLFSNVLDMHNIWNKVKLDVITDVHQIIWE